MRNLLWFVMVFLIAVFIAGCTSTSLDKAAMRELDESVQKVTKENDQYIDKDSALDSTQKNAAHARNDGARELTRKAARASGNIDLSENWNK